MSAKWLAKIENWLGKKYFDGETQEKIASYNILW